jgi:hypothetical protein
MGNDDDVYVFFFGSRFLIKRLALAAAEGPAILLVLVAGAGLGMAG